MVSRLSRKRFRRRLAAAGLVAFAALLLLLGLAIPRLVQGRMEAALNAAGLGPVQLVLAWDGLGRLGGGPLRLGSSGAPTADRVEITLSPASLAAGRIESLTLIGLRLRAAIEQNGAIALQGMPHLALSSGGESSPALPVTRIRLEDAQLEAATPAGAVALHLDGALNATEAGLALDSSLTLSIAGARLSLPDLRLAPEPGGWHLRAAQATADYPAADIALAEIAFDLDWKGGAATLTTEIGTVKDRLTPARFPPLSARLNGQGSASRIDFSFEIADEKKRVTLSVKGRHDPAAGRGNAEIDGRIAPFHAQGLQPGDLAPAFAQLLPPIEGRLGLGGSIAWSGTRLAPHLLLTLADFGGTFGAVRLRNGHGALLLDSLAPPATPPDQPFAATLSLGDMEPMPLEARLQMRRDGALAIESVTLGLAAGSLRTGDLLFRPADGVPADLALPVEIAGVELGQLLRLIDMEGLSGEGKLDGRLPLKVVAGEKGTRKILLEQGRLTGRDGGVLRYAGGGLPEQAGGAGGQSVDLLRDVLKDFHYRSFAAELEQSADGAGGVLLHLDGSNPAVLNGRRFLLNIRLDANFDRLAQIFLSGLEAAQDLTRSSLAPRR